MTAQTFRLDNNYMRRETCRAVQVAHEGVVVEIRPAKRSLDQNDRFHALVSDIVKSGFVWRGDKLDADDWKTLLVSAHDRATDHPARVMPGLEGEYVSMRRSTAKMNKAEMSSLIEYVTAWMVGNNIPIRDGANT